MREEQIAVLEMSQDLLRLVIVKTEEAVGADVGFPITILVAEAQRAIADLLAETRGSRAAAGTKA